MVRAEHHASRRVIEKIGMTYQRSEGDDVIYAITHSQTIE